MDRRYAYIGAHRVHYRRSGQGQPVVVLHGFPRSSQSVEGLAKALGDGSCFIALDLPGYGESTPLPGVEKPGLADYASWLDEVTTGLGLTRFDLVAFETAAPLAAAFTRTYSAKVRKLVCVEPPGESETERNDLLVNGCPEIIPDSEGSHVTKAWGRLRDSYIFRPWYRREQGARLYRDIPDPQVLYNEFVDFWRAGPNYGDGLKASWSVDWLRSGAPKGLSVICTAKVAQGLGRRAVTIPIDSADDVAAIAAGIKSIPAEGELPAAPPPPKVEFVSDAVRRDYAATSIGQILVRYIAAKTPGKRPLMTCHGSLWSAAGAEYKLPNLNDERDVFIFDVPGVGDSPALADPQPPMADLAAILVEGVKALGIDEYDVQGGHSGAMIAIDIAILDPDKVKHIVLEGITNFSIETWAEMKPHYLQPLRVSDDGAFANWAWQFLRDMFLWYPWYMHKGAKARPDGLVNTPEAQHRSFVDFLKGGRSFPAYYNAAMSFPTNARLPLVKAKTLLCASLLDTLREETMDAVRLLPGSIFRTTPGRSTPEAVKGTEDIWLAFLDDQPIPEDAQAS